MPQDARSRPESYHNDSEYYAKHSPRRRSRLKTVIWTVCVLALLGTIAGGVGVAVVLTKIGRTPRQWAPYLQRRAEEHNPLIVGSVNLVAWWLNHADRMAVSKPFPIPSFVGASPDRSGPVPPGQLRTVSNVQQFEAAVASAQPGDVIQIAPGHYDFPRTVIQRPGTAAAPITLRAARLGDVVIDSHSGELLKFYGPYWHVENFVFRGVCRYDAECDNCLHIVAGAKHVLIRNNHFEDFNAAIKINSEQGKYPDDGIIEGNSFTASHPRRDSNPITPIDLDVASHWDIRDNFIADFVRDYYRGGPTYGAFAKGTGTGNVFERNVVICQWKLRGWPGEQVGLSLGGGGMYPASLRRGDGPVSGIEQIAGVIRNNLIASCGDEGIYLNKATRSIVEHNTLLDTSGIEVRFPQTSAEVIGNMVDGVIVVRHGAIIHARDNITSNLLGLFAGWHPVRKYFADPASLDLRWRSRPPMLADPDPGKDLCGAVRGPVSRPGAFNNYARCLQGR